MAHSYRQFVIDLVGMPFAVIGNDCSAEHGPGGRPHPKTDPQTSDLTFGGKNTGHLRVDPFEVIHADSGRHHTHHKEDSLVNGTSATVFRLMSDS
jgi:hypothetical protein